MRIEKTRSQADINSDGDVREQPSRGARATARVPSARDKPEPPSLSEQEANKIMGRKGTEAAGQARVKPNPGAGGNGARLAHAAAFAWRDATDERARRGGAHLTWKRLETRSAPRCASTAPRKAS